MAWLVGAAGTSGAAGGAAAGAGTAASTGAASAAGAGATGTAVGAGTSGATTSAAGSAGAAGAAKGIGSSAAKDFIKDTAKDAAQSAISNEINREDKVNPISNTFDPSGIASDRNNKSNIQRASFEKHEAKKPEKEKLPGVDLLHGFVDGVNNILTSDETKKENVTDVSSESGESNDKPKSSLSRFNSTMKSLGQELGAYAKEAGKNFISQAIASSAQPQQVNPISPGFTGAQVSSDENLKENIEDAGGIIPMMAQINSYLYNYKPEAQEEYAGTGMMNNDNNLGVMAQDLQENPLTAPAVKTDEKGNLALDTGRLTSINTAMIAELCKKVMELEGQLYGRS